MINIKGEFAGECSCKFLDGTKCVLMSRKTAKAVLKFIKKDRLSTEEKTYVAGFLLRLEGITHGGEG